MNNKQSETNKKQQGIIEYPIKIQDFIEHEIGKRIEGKVIKRFGFYATIVTIILGTLGVSVRSWLIQRAEEQVKSQVEAAVKKLESRVQTAEKQLEIELQKANNLEAQLTGNMLTSLTKVAGQLGTADSKAQEVERLLDKLSQEAEVHLKAFTDELNERSGEFVQKMVELEQQKEEINQLIMQTRSGISVLEQRIENLEQESTKGISSNQTGQPHFLTLFKEGNSYYRDGNVTQALDTFQRGLRQIAQPLNLMAWIYQEQGNFEKGLPLAQMAVDIAPEEPIFLDTLAVILCKMDKKHEALDLIHKAVSLNPQKFKKQLENMQNGQCE